jgi:hypothetical protein
MYGPRRFSPRVLGAMLVTAILCTIFVTLIGALPTRADDAGAKFTPGPNLNEARGLHFIATLPDGQVIVFGGFGGYVDGSPVYPQSAEIWTPATGSFTLKAMNSARYGSAFAKLADGRYLLAGGTPDPDTAEIYDPAGDSFTSMGTMAISLSFASAATLSSGKVLVVGYGSSQGELFDPADGTFTATDPLHPLQTPRENPVILPAADGTALVLGGYNYESGTWVEQVESYDPGTNSFSILPNPLVPGESGWYTGGGPYNLFSRSMETQMMGDGRYLFPATKLISGSEYQLALLTFDPVTKQIDKFNVTPQLPTLSADSVNQAFLWPVVDARAGKAYVIYDDQIITVSLKTSSRNAPPGYYTDTYRLLFFPGVTLLRDGRIFITGGYGYAPANSTTQTIFANPRRNIVSPILQLLLLSD